MLPSPNTRDSTKQKLRISWLDLTGIDVMNSKHSSNTTQVSFDNAFNICFYSTMKQSRGINTRKIPCSVQIKGQLINRKCSLAERFMSRTCCRAKLIHCIFRNKRYRRRRYCYLSIYLFIIHFGAVSAIPHAVKHVDKLTNKVRRDLSVK